MALRYDPDSFDSPTLPLDLGVAVTSENIDALTQPVKKQNGSSGSTFQNAIDNVLDLFDNGKKIYDGVMDTIGTAKAQAAQKKAQAQTVVVAPANASVILGLNTNQLILITVGLAALVVVPKLLRR